MADNLRNQSGILTLNLNNLHGLSWNKLICRGFMRIFIFLRKVDVPILMLLLERRIWVLGVGCWLLASNQWPVASCQLPAASSQLPSDSQINVI
jgi:hypothetical protein